METNELNRVDALRLDSGYAGQEELLRDLMAWLDLNLYYYYAHHQWLGPSSEMKNLLGLVVTREEFDTAQSEQFVSERFGGSLPAFVAAFTAGKKLKPEEVAELKALIDAME